MDDDTEQPPGTGPSAASSRSTARSDGLAAVAIIIVTIALIAFVVSQLVAS